MKRQYHRNAHIIGCLLLGVAAAQGCAGRSDVVAPVDASAPAKETAPVARTAESTGTVPATDFRYQFVVAAKAIAPAVVSITSTEVVTRGHPGAPFEGTPFEFFFRGHPELNQPRLKRGVGSGTIIDTKGHILTNNHVVAGADRVKVLLADNQEFEAKVVGTDPHTDLAVVSIDPGATKLQAAVLGDSDALQVGEWVVACGSPFGLKQTVSAGIVSALSRGNVGISDYEDFIQTDAAINPGNSGGPLVDLTGRVVGVNTAIASQSGGNNGVGFAIPIKMAEQIVRQLLEHGKVVRGYVGLYIGDVSNKLAESFGYEGAGGALVQDVTAGGPGAEAGIKPGDIIMECDGKPISSAADFRNTIAAKAPGTAVSLKIWRDRKPITESVKLGELRGGEAGSLPAGSSQEAAPRWGLSLSNVPVGDDRLRGMPEQGALVRNVQPESAADDSGLRPGDVIVEIEGREVRNAADAQNQLREAKGALRLRIVRNGHGLYLILNPPAKQ